MKIRALKFALVCILLPTIGAAQNPALKLPDFGSLSGKAIESVNITLSPWLLRTMAAFVDDKDADSAATKRLLGGIKSIQVRSYQFASDFAYSIADIDAVRQQLAAPGWSRLMQVHNRDKNEDVDMYVLVENDRTTGFALITSDQRGRPAKASGSIAPAQGKHGRGEAIDVTAGRLTAYAVRFAPDKLR